MSTKIYQGYRVKTQDFNDFLKHIWQGTMELTIEKVKVLMSAVKPEIVPELIEKYRLTDFKPRDGLPPDFVELYAKWQFLEEQFQAHHDNQKRFEVFDIQSAWAFFLDGDYFYGWPSDMVQLGHDAVMSFERVEDYCYWNNTDHPKEVSQDEWDSRGETWRRVFRNPRLIYPIVDYSPGAYDARAEIQQQILKWPD